MITGIVATIIFSLQLERIPSIKFPEETSRAEQAGYISFICLLWQLLTNTHIALHLE